MRKGTKKGFTLIELSFAILFISVLLLTLTLIASEIISIYRKGYAIKTVNSVGRELIDDFKDAIAESPPAKLSSFCNKYTESETRAVCESSTNGGLEFIYQQFYTKIDNNSAGKTDENLPYGGVFCTGKYSYIWKTGFLMNPELYTIDDSFDLKFIYGDVYYAKTKDNAITDKTYMGDFRLLKINDNNRDLCQANLNLDIEASSGGSSYTDDPATVDDDDINPYYYNTRANGGTIEYKTGTELPVEFLSTSDSPLALFSLAVYPPAQTTDTGKTLYSSSFILATVAGGVNIMTNSNFCSAALTNSADFSFCAINKFNFSMQANGG